MVYVCSRSFRRGFLDYARNDIASDYGYPPHPPIQKNTASGKLTVRFRYKNLKLLSLVRKERDSAGAFYGERKLTLMLGAGTRSAAGNDLTLFGYETFKSRNVLVVDLLDFLGAERANLFLGGASELLGLVVRFDVFVDIFLIHNNKPLKC